MDFKSYIKTKIPSEKNFGYTFTLIFLIIGIYFFLTNNIFLFFLLLSFSGIFLFITLFFSKLLKYLNLIWFKLGYFLALIISPIIILCIYFLIICPTGIYVRIFKKSLILKKIDNQIDSYWIKRKNKINSMKEQF